MSISKASIQTTVRSMVELLGDLAPLVTLRAAGVYDPTTRTTPAGVTQDVNGVWDNFRTRDFDGTTIKVGDRKFIAILPEGFTADQAEAISQVVDGTKTWSVQSVEIDPADATAIYHLRGV